MVTIPMHVAAGSSPSTGPKRSLTGSLQIAADPQAPTFRARMRIMPVLDNPRLWEVQATAIRNLEESLRADRPRALIQMATGSCSPAYRPHGRALSASRHRNDLACTEASAADARDSDAAVPGA